MTDEEIRSAVARLAKSYDSEPEYKIVFRHQLESAGLEVAKVEAWIEANGGMIRARLDPKHRPLGAPASTGETYWLIPPSALEDQSSV